jgi:CMP-N-acetylneuraminic acid synthetase
VKIVGMIPARAGSKRIKSKNLRFLDGKPLIEHIVEAAANVSLFDTVYLNSEDETFQTIAEKHGLSFYKRSTELASDSATNDDFALDFINRVGGDILVQMLPTSPFIDAEMIRSFVQDMLETEVDTLISVTDVRIECLYQGNAINFDPKAQTPPSQLLTPVKAYACGLMGWKTECFIQNMEKFGSAYHGGDGKIGLFTIKGLGAIDIDEEHDFAIAEAICKARTGSSATVRYFGSDDT